MGLDDYSDAMGHGTPNDFSQSYLGAGVKVRFGLLNEYGLARLGCDERRKDGQNFRYAESYVRDIDRRVPLAGLWQASDQ